MPFNVNHLGGEDVGEAGCEPFDIFDFQPCHREALAELVDVGFDRNEFAQPAQREFHDAASPERNCCKNRISFSKNSRMSSTPSFSSDIRSTPIPKAKP